MVKRQDIKAGALIKVTKALPTGSHAGPQFKGTFAVHERLEVLGIPFKSGALNLVKVKRRTTKEVISVIYSFVTHYCAIVDTEDDETPTVPAPTAVLDDKPDPKPGGTP